MYRHICTHAHSKPFKHEKTLCATQYVSFGLTDVILLNHWSVYQPLTLAAGQLFRLTLSLFCSDIFIKVTIIFSSISLSSAEITSVFLWVICNQVLFESLSGCYHGVSRIYVSIHNFCQSKDSSMALLLIFIMHF